MEYIVSGSSIYLFTRSAIVSNIEQNMSGKMIQSMGSPKLLHSRWRGSNDSVGVGERGEGNMYKSVYICYWLLYLGKAS